MADDLIITHNQYDGRMIVRKNNCFRAAFFFGFASLASWMPTLTVWLEDQGIKGSSIGYVSAIPWIVMLVLQPAWGIMADKAGKKQCFTVAALAATILFVCYALSGSDITTIIIMTVLVSLFNTPVLPLLDSMALDHTERHSSISYSSLRFWGAPGFAAGAFLTANLIPRFGIDIMLYMSGFFLLITWIAIFILPVNALTVKSSALSFNGLGAVMKNKMLLIFLFIITAVSVGQSSSSFYLTIYLREIGSTPEITGTALAVQALSELPFYFVAAWLLRRTSAPNILLIAIFGTALRLFLYSINQNPFSVIGIETLNGITWTLLWIASVEYVNAIVPAHWRSTGQSLLWAAYFGGGAIAGNILSGRLYEIMPMQRVFGINSALICVVAMIAVGLFLFFRGKPVPVKSTMS